jgi:hypothetical protein
MHGIKLHARSDYGDSHRDHRAAKNIEFSMNSPSYVCVPTAGDLAYCQSACAPPSNRAGRREGGDVKLLANPLSSKCSHALTGRNSLNGLPLYTSMIETDTYSSLI